MMYEDYKKEFYKKFTEPREDKDGTYYHTDMETVKIWEWIKDKLAQERADAYNEGLRDF